MFEHFNNKKRLEISKTSKETGRIWDGLKVTLGRLNRLGVDSGRFRTDLEKRKFETREFRIEKSTFK